jgi:UDP-glucose 4-epimerase
VPTVGLRFFNVFGPRQDPGSPYSGVISIFADRLRRGAPVELFGDGGQTRDFVYVADVVAALRTAMRRLPPGAPVFNICSGTATSVRDLAITLAALCNQVPDLQSRPPRPGDIRHSVGTAAAARSALGLPPPTPLRDGLARVLDWLAAAA